jgi:hypothetical protein
MSSTPTAGVRRSTCLEPWARRSPFCKLIAFAISCSRGFQESDAFQSDPQRGELAGWYETICAADGAHPTSSGNITPAGDDFVDVDGILAHRRERAEEAAPAASLGARAPPQASLF